MAGILKSPDDVLDYAISSEENAIAAFSDMARMVSDERTRNLLEGLIKQESAHKEQLLSLKADDKFAGKIIDLTVLEDALTPESNVSTGQMSENEIMAYAIKAEKDSALLYDALAQMVSDDSIAETFSMLGEAERKHEKLLSSLT